MRQNEVGATKPAKRAGDTARDALVAELTESLREAGEAAETCQAELAQVRRRLAEVELERDTALADGEGYAESGRLVAEMSTKLVDKWRVEVDELRAELSATRLREQELRSECDIVQAELDQIGRSRAWQVMGRYRGLRTRGGPPS